jgi:hypothetical protein
MADHARGGVGLIAHIAALNENALAAADKCSAELNVGGDERASEYGEKQEGKDDSTAAKLHDKYLGWRVYRAGA